MVCSVCGIDKPITEFPRNGKDKTGATAYRNDCKECYSITRKINKRKHAKFVSNTRHRTGEEQTLSLRDWREVMLYFRGACGYCRTKQSRRVKLTKEHVVPVSKGGRTVRANIIPGCVACNCSKGDSDMETWYRQQRFFSEMQLLLIKRWISQ